MANFQLAILAVLGNEGGETAENSPFDRGGLTKFGITHIDAGEFGYDVRALTKVQAIDIYRRKYWDGYLHSQLDAVKDQDIGTAVFDMAVNTGPKPAVTALQTALGKLGLRVATDGIIGPETVSAVNSVPASIMIAAFRRERALFYCRLTRSAVRSGRDVLVHRLTDALGAAGMKAPDIAKAIQDINQVENLGGWVNRSLVT